MVHGGTGRDPGYHAPPVLLRDEQAAAGASAAVRGRLGAQGGGVPPDADPGPPGRPGHGGLGPLPPAVAGQHAAVPGGQGAVLRRQLLQRRARVRPAQAAAHRARGAVRAHLAGRAGRGLRLRVLQRAAGRPLDHVPDLHRAAAERPAGGADLHQYLRPAAPPAGTVRQARPDPAGDHRRRAPRSAERGPGPEFDARAVEWIGNGDLSSVLANVTLDSLHSPGNATHGFMDFMLMMGVAGYNKADYVDNLDLFHTMEAYFTWYPNGDPGAAGAEGAGA